MNFSLLTFRTLMFNSIVVKAKQFLYFAHLDASLAFSHLLCWHFKNLSKRTLLISNRFRATFFPPADFHSSMNKSSLTFTLRKAPTVYRQALLGDWIPEWKCLSALTNLCLELVRLNCVHDLIVAWAKQIMNRQRDENLSEFPFSGPKEIQRKWATWNVACLSNLLEKWQHFYLHFAMKANYFQCICWMIYPSLIIPKCYFTILWICRLFQKGLCSSFCLQVSPSGKKSILWHFYFSLGLFLWS